jgi:hypothetical protein|tara:strand:- start:83 stop:334 length:252 start_codon:yes stop_codon:yes gene_type:complete
MFQYKLSYYVAGDNTENIKIADNEIQLAANILDMERDVGFLCHGVTIEQGDFDNKNQYSNKSALLDIQRWSKVLMKAPHLNIK